MAAVATLYPRKDGTVWLTDDSPISIFSQSTMDIDQSPPSTPSGSSMASDQSPPSTPSGSTTVCDLSDDLDDCVGIAFQSVWSTYPVISELDNDYEAVEVPHAESRKRNAVENRFSFELDPVLLDSDPIICEADDVDNTFFDRTSLATAGVVCRSAATAQRSSPYKDMMHCTVLALASRCAPIDPIVVGKPFTIEIDRYFGGSVGLGITKVRRKNGETLGSYVKNIKEDGLVRAWNKANPNNMVCVGDRVLSINGHAVTDNLHDELAKNMAWRVELIREIEQPPKSMTKDRQPKSPGSRAAFKRLQKVAGPKRLQRARCEEGGISAKPIEKTKATNRNQVAEKVCAYLANNTELTKKLIREIEQPRKSAGTVNHQQQAAEMERLRQAGLIPQEDVIYTKPIQKNGEKESNQAGDSAVHTALRYREKDQDVKKHPETPRSPRSPPPMKTPRKSQGVVGCDRHATKGKTQGGKPSGQGRDARCVDTVSPAADQAILNQLPTKPKNPMLSPRHTADVKDANSRQMSKHGCGRHVEPGRSKPGKVFASL